MSARNRSGCMRPVNKYSLMAERSGQALLGVNRYFAGKRRAEPSSHRRSHHSEHDAPVGMQGTPSAKLPNTRQTPEGSAALAALVAGGLTAWPRLQR
jgi:hypothetical protein